MTPFVPTQLPRRAFSYRHYMETYGLSKPDAKRIVARFKLEKVFLNEDYQVNVQPPEPDHPSGFPSMIHLSIKRRDRQPIHDWRELQAIKNMLVGAEHEAVELYPAESRLVDTANQYHLWVLTDPTKRFPFGFRERLVINAGPGRADDGSVQRPLIDDFQKTTTPPAEEGQKDLQA